MLSDSKAVAAGESTALKHELLLFAGSQGENMSDDFEKIYDDDEDDDVMDSRFLEVCMDGDVEDLVQLFEEIARSGEILTAKDLNCIDASGRVPKRQSLKKSPKSTIIFNCSQP